MKIEKEDKVSIFEKKKILSLNKFFMKNVLFGIVFSSLLFILTVILLVFCILVTDLNEAIKISIISMVATFILTTSKTLIDRVVEVVIYTIRLLGEEQRGLNKKIGIEMNEVEFNELSEDEQKKKGITMKKCNGGYNPKLEFKMLGHLNKHRSLKESMTIQKEIFEGTRKEGTTESEKHLRKSVDAFMILKNCQEMTKEKLTEIYLCYENKPLSNETLDNLVELIKQDIDEYLTYPIRVLITIIKYEVFNEYSREMAILLFNYMLIRNGYHPLIFYVTFTNRLEELIKNGAIVESIFRILEPIIITSTEYNKIQDFITSDEVEKRIKEHEKTFRENYKINHMMIYGSLSRGEQNEYSDIDLIIITDKYNEFMNNEIRSFIRNLFSQRVDMVFISENSVVKDMCVDFYTDRINIF